MERERKIKRTKDYLNAWNRLSAYYVLLSTLFTCTKSKKCNMIANDRTIASHSAIIRKQIFRITGSDQHSVLMGIIPTLLRAANAHKTLPLYQLTFLCEGFPTARTSRLT